MTTYLYGRYRKLEPGISQRVRACPDCDGTGTRAARDCPTLCARCRGTGRLSSVEELLAWTVRDATDAEAVTFHTAGREGVEMLTLGTGRPFVLELTAPRSESPDLDALQREITAAASGRTEVDGLAIGTPDIVNFVTRHPFRQRFRLTVTLPVSVTRSAFEAAVETLRSGSVHRHLDMTDLDRSQRPHEVVRSLRAVDWTWEGAGRATLSFEIEPGIHPKAIATGEDGRTEPSLAGLLGVPLKVTEIAVVAVRGKNSPFENPSYLRS